jgi:hypothetical protein
MALRLCIQIVMGRIEFARLRPLNPEDSPPRASGSTIGPARRGRSESARLARIFVLIPFVFDDGRPSCPDVEANDAPATRIASEIDRPIRVILNLGKEFETSS